MHAFVTKLRAVLPGVKDWMDHALRPMRTLHLQSHSLLLSGSAIVILTRYLAGLGSWLYRRFHFLRCRNWNTGIPGYGNDAISRSDL